MEPLTPETAAFLFNVVNTIPINPEDPDHNLTVERVTKARNEIHGILLSFGNRQENQWKATL